MRALGLMLVMILMSCQTTASWSHTDSNIIVAIHPNNYYANSVKIYCDDVLIRTVRPLTFKKTELVYVTKRDGRCDRLKFSINNSQTYQDILYDGGVINLMIHPSNINNSYVYSM